MATLRREDEIWLPFAEKMREVVCEVYDMKFILGGVLEYRNADLAASYSRARCDFISQRKWGTKGFLDCLV